MQNKEATTPEFTWAAAKDPVPPTHVCVKNLQAKKKKHCQGKHRRYARANIARANI